MKNVFKVMAFVSCILLLSSFLNAQKPMEVRYKDMVHQNPNAEKDIKVVSDFVNALVSGDLNTIKSLTTANYKAYGPSPEDSADIDKTITGWQENYKTQTNRSVNFLTESFQVMSGDLKGDWVSLWGNYTFTQNGKTVTFPFQYTAHVTDGKISTDRIYYDRLYILQKLGFTITPPAQN